MKQTDWNSYYSKPYKASSLTRRITGNKVVKLIQEYSVKNKKLQIVELGGANSCFYELINNKIRPSHYKIIDNNKLGLDKFAHRIKQNTSVSLEESDILNIDKDRQGDFQVVFSVGLIEHFSVADTAKAISAHFKFIEEEAICIITFPTPTWLYKLSRRIAEFLNMWIFHDERPLSFEEVEKEICKHGIILHKSITWTIFFTQGVIVVQKKPQQKN
jgi:hypothetical protein